MRVALLGLLGVEAFVPLNPPTTTSMKFKATLEAAMPVVLQQQQKTPEEALAERITEDLVDESCAVEAPPLECVDEAELTSMRSRLRRLISSTAKMEEPTLEAGDLLEAGWEQVGQRSSLRRNLGVWRKLAVCVFKVLKAKTSEEKTTAAIFARDSLLQLGPTFVKLGQVLSTRTDVVEKEYIDVLKSLQDDVPAFSGAKAKAIVAKELNVSDISEIFRDFDEEPLAAASLGQVHTATLQVGNVTQKVAIKVQRAGLKELFDVDLKNLRKLCELLDKLDPKADGADRSYIDVFDESEKLLYEEIDYINEADNADRFRRDFQTGSSENSKFNVRIPEVYREYSTPRVLTMEYVDSFKLTDLAQVDKVGLDRQELAKRTAESFLYQIIETGFFHCDPHPGNLCVDETGKLVYYDFGMMDELKPNVRRGFKKFCYALFDGGPFISEIQLAARAKELCDAVEEMGVLAKGADRISCEQLARYFIQTFKQAQISGGSQDKKKNRKKGNIKTSLGNELQSLTESQVFRFPSTFTFIFRAIASIDGIGKGLDKGYDLSKLAQPFVEKLIASEKSGLAIAAEATGLNLRDINTAVSTPRKIAYLEDTIRSIEQGNLKIRVRSLENEIALSRLSAQNKITTSFVLASLALNLALIAEVGVPALAATGIAAALSLRGLKAIASLAAMDKKNLKYSGTKTFASSTDDDD